MFGEALSRPFFRQRLRMHSVCNASNVAAASPYEGSIEKANKAYGDLPIKNPSIQNLNSFIFA
jgi:hypothetical protein